MAEERRVEQGQRMHGAMSYRTYNTMLELTRQQRLQRLGDQGGDAQEHTPGYGLEVLVQNQTGSFQPPGSVLSILQGTPLDPAGQAADFQARPCLYGVVPVASTDVVGVLRDGLAVGQTGLAVVRGLCIVALDLTSTAHTSAVPIAGDSSQMASGATGHPILWTQTGATGPQQAVVLLDGGANPPTPTIEVKQSDGTHDVTGITTLIVDQGTGLAWEANTSSTYTLQLLAATITQEGAVTTTDQTWAGSKVINDEVVAITTLQVGGDTSFTNQNGLTLLPGAMGAVNSLGPGVDQKGLIYPFCLGPDASFLFSPYGVEFAYLTASSKFRLTLCATGETSGVAVFAVRDKAGSYHEGLTTTTAGATFTGGILTSGSISAGLTVGTTPVSGGTAGSVLIVGSGGNLGQTTLSGSGAPVGSPAGAGLVYFDVSDPNNPQFYWST